MIKFHKQGEIKYTYQEKYTYIKFSFSSLNHKKICQKILELYCPYTHQQIQSHELQKEIVKYEPQQQSFGFKLNMVKKSNEKSPPKYNPNKFINNMIFSAEHILNEKLFPSPIFQAKTLRINISSSQQFQNPYKLLSFLNKIPNLETLTLGMDFYIDEEDYPDYNEQKMDRIYKKFSSIFFQNLPPQITDLQIVNDDVPIKDDTQSTYPQYMYDTLFQNLDFIKSLKKFKFASFHNEAPSSYVSTQKLSQSLPLMTNLESFIFQDGSKNNLPSQDIMQLVKSITQIQKLKQFELYIQNHNHLEIKDIRQIVNTIENMTYLEDINLIINSELKLKYEDLFNLYQKLASFPNLKVLSITIPTHGPTCQEIKDTLQNFKNFKNLKKLEYQASYKEDEPIENLNLEQEQQDLSKYIPILELDIW